MFTGMEWFTAIRGYAGCGVSIQPFFRKIWCLFLDRWGTIEPS